MCMGFVRLKFGLALVAVAAGLTSILTAAPTFAQGMTLQGAWMVTTQQVNCATQVPMGPPHRALVSFHAGGTLSDNSAVPAFLVGQRSEGHGTWSHDGGHKYISHWVAMIVFETAPNTPPGSPGFVPGWQIATNAIELTGHDHFTSSGVSRFVNLAGVEYRTGCATRVGERFK